MTAGEERGAPAPYAYVGWPVKVVPAGGEMRDLRGVLEDVSQLGAELLVDGRRCFVPWSGVARMELVEEREPGGMRS